MNMQVTAKDIDRIYSTGAYNKMTGYKSISLMEQRPLTKLPSD